MGLPLSQTPFDAETYLAWEAGQTDKSEYVAGEVFAMVGVRRVHATVAGNIFAALRKHLRGSPCLPFIADMKLRLDTIGLWLQECARLCDTGQRLTLASAQTKLYAAEAFLQSSLDAVQAAVTDFIVATADLAADPVAGERIEYNGRLYEVTPLGEEPCWRWTDASHRARRIHTRDAGAA